VQCGSSCVDTQTSDQNCGGCDQPCAIGQACKTGKCEVSCTTAQTLCSGLCVDTQSNAQHCGDCATACPAGQTCNAGKCEISCPGGQVACSGLCYDLQSDQSHCGACTTQCKSSEVCSSGSCALNCQSGQTACSGACVDLQTSSSNCGTCGKACGQNEECSAGKCVIACKTLLNQPIADPWGTSWDGLERAAKDLATAETTCSGIGGRLPTATELYRVSATQSATVGQTINTNYLWSNVPQNTTNQIRVRLSDASVNSSAKTSSLNYRCVCPAPLPDTFTGNNCYGATGQACYALDGEGKRYNMDLEDRAPLPVGSAVWECAFNRGHLANSVTLFEALEQGLPNGSNNWLHTSDMARYDLDIVTRWQDAVKSPTVDGVSSWGNTTNFRPFRCVGENYAAGAHPGSVPDEFTAPTTPYKSEKVDSAAKDDWATANDTCFSRGGHVPRTVDLAELIQQGLPGGTAGWLWTSDQVGYNGANFLVEVAKWTGTAPDFGFVSPADVNWAYKTKTYAYRCIYYPVDKTYTGPKAADCAGGCTTFTLPDSSGDKIWLDSFDRAPPASLDVAVDTYRQNGGHLASERDLMEAIRQGLPNGSSTWIWTSDLSIGSSGIAQLRAQIVKWTGTDKTFTDQWQTYSTWSGLGSTTRPYRCMWTNELR